MSTRQSLGSLSLLAIFLTSCGAELRAQRLLIEDLDRRLGTAPPLQRADGVQLQKDTNADFDDKEAQLIRIVSMLKTGRPTPIDLSEVRRNMLENNLGLQASLLNPEIAAERVRAEQAKFEATFTLSVDRQRTVSPLYFGSASLDVTSDTLTIIPGITVPLRSGGTVNLDWSMITSKYNSEGTSGDDQFAITRPTIALEQPLLRDAGLDYNEASIVIAEANAGAMQGTTQLAVISELRHAETGYWNLYLAWRALGINVEFYKTSRKLLDEQRVLVAHQNASIANVYNFEVAMAHSVDRVLESERTLRLAVRRLKLLMQEPDMSLDGSMALQPATKPRMVAYEFNPQQLVKFALENRADLLELEYRRIQKTIEVMVKENRVLPQFDVSGSWTFNGFDAKSVSLHNAHHDLFSGNEPGGWMVGLNASVPIGNKVALANHRASLLRRLKAIADLRNREITVTSEVLDAIDTAETRWQQVVTTHYQEQAAHRFFDAYRTLFDRGQIPSSNLTQALRARASSQVEAVRSVVQYQIAMAQLAYAAGCLLGHAGVDWGNYVDKKRLEKPFPSPATPLPDSFDNTLDSGGPSVETLAPDTDTKDQPNHPGSISPIGVPSGTTSP